MSEKDVILKAISLLEAIKTNNIDLTKSIVDELNANFVPTENVINFNELLPLYDIYSNLKVSNESFEYVLDNLKNIFNIDRIRWSISIRKILIEDNKAKMEELIINTLNKKDLADYQIPLLVQLSVTVDRYDLLNQIRERIKEA